MIIVKTIADLKKVLKNLKKENKRIGFVPTMGYLHGGHLSLIKKAIEETDIVVVSIFVNPTQFGPQEDFSSYPRDLEKDSKLAAAAGAEIIFAPPVEEIYPADFKTFVEVEELTKNLCGASRPGHFRGVATVVAKLFNLVTPHKAYFGQKDAQQAIVIKKMVQDLNFDMEIIICPIVREKDGLAMSSRNVYLNQEERRQAAVLFAALNYGRKLIESGEKNANFIKEEITKKIKTMDLAQIDYVALVDLTSLQDIEEIKKDVLIALAVRFGKTRLIDNMIVGVE